MYPRDYGFEVIACKTGRIRKESPLEDHFVVQKTYDFYDHQEIPEWKTCELGRSIMRAVHEMPGHDFSNPAEYTVSAITVDSSLRAHQIRIPMFRPESASTGHLFYRSVRGVESLAKVTFDKLTREEADVSELRIVVSTFEAYDVLLIVPHGMVLPHLTHHLNLLGRPVDGMYDPNRSWGVDVRLCDGKGLGRSAPQISDDKFRFLFPDTAIDKSLVKPRASRAIAKPVALVASPVPAKRTYSEYCA